MEKMKVKSTVESDNGLDIVVTTGKTIKELLENLRYDRPIRSLFPARFCLVEGYYCLMDLSQYFNEQIYLEENIEQTDLSSLPTWSVIGANFPTDLKSLGLRPYGEYNIPMVCLSSLSEEKVIDVLSKYLNNSQDCRVALNSSGCDETFVWGLYWNSSDGLWYLSPIPLDWYRSSDKQDKIKIKDTEITLL